MSETKIEWADYTFNAWWGCVEAGPECDNCYARTFSHRLGFKLWGRDAERRHASESYWREPERWNAAAARAGERHRVFAHSMSDVLEDRRDLDSPRARLWELIERTPSLDWLLLTKRPAGFATLTPAGWRERWPRNAWAGTTCGAHAGLKRVETLIEATPGAAVRFVSAEPLLGPLDFTDRPLDPMSTMGDWTLLDEIQWLIVGAESGPGARQMEEAWARSVKDQCVAAGVAFFLKQYADPRGHKIPTPELDGRRWLEFPRTEATA